MFSPTPLACLASDKLLDMEVNAMDSGITMRVKEELNTLTDLLVSQTSQSEFIIPGDKGMEDVNNNIIVGMIFKMRFEGEEPPKRREVCSMVRKIFFYTCVEEDKISLTKSLQGGRENLPNNSDEQPKMREAFKEMSSEQME